MLVGKMRERLTLEKPVENKDSVGQTVKGWAAVGEVWGEAITLSGRELLKASAEKAELNISFRIRLRSDVRATWRVLYNDGTYYIKAPPICDRKKGELLLLCSAGVANG